MARPALSLAAALVLRAVGSARGVADVAALVQQRAVRHEEPSKHFTLAVGQRVELEGYPVDKNITIIGYGAGPERYHLHMEGNKPLLNVEGKFVKAWTTPFPRSQDPMAGPVKTLMGFHLESQEKPYIVSRGEKPNSWDVYVPGHGLVPNIDDSEIIRERSFYAHTTPRPHGREHTVAAVLTGSLPSQKKGGNDWMTTQQPTLPPMAQATPELEPIALKSEVDPLTDAAAVLTETNPAEAAPQEEPQPMTEKTTLSRKVIKLEPKANGLGLDVRFSKGDGRHQYKEELLLVDSISEDGAVAAWNARHPFSRLNVGDRIMQVNGLGGGAHKLDLALKPFMNGSQPAAVHLVAEKPGMPAGEGIELALSNIKLYMEKGPKEFLRESLPFDMGKVFINAADTVRECKDISSALLCGSSEEKYGITCAGWSGGDCLTKTEVSCERLQSEGVCNAASERFGLECAGWGGSSCLSKGAEPSSITDETACWHAERKLGMEVAGWGGSSCLARGASCKEITLPGLCNNAEAKLGISCLGWGGGSCLDNGAGAELIANEALCAKSTEKFGIESAGWSGSKCLKKGEATCGAITDPAICSRAQERLGLTCAGWGGSSCLDVGAAPELITAAAICQRSKQTLGIKSGGWSGSACLPAGVVTCDAITHPGVCNDAANRLGLDCAGWAGKECLASGHAKCNRITTSGICEKSLARLGIECVWNGYECLPDAAR